MKKVLLAACIACAAFTAAAAFSACVTEEEHVHDMTTHEAVAATCTEDGNTAYYECDGCGKYFSDEAGENEISLSDTVVPATGHDMTAVAAKDATCTEPGNSAYYVCDNCDKYFSDETGENEIQLADTVISAKGHDTTLVAAKDATCTEDGNSAYYVCDNCKKYFSDEAGKNEIQQSSTIIPAKGHDTTLVAAKDATCTEPGNNAYYVCDNCGKYFSDEAGENEIELSSTVIPAAGHDTTLVAAKDATCTEDGNTAYYVCDNCKKYFSDEAGENEIQLADTVISAKGHDTTLVAAKDATCTEPGNSAYYVCDNCKKYFSDEAGENEIQLSSVEIPAKGHGETEQKVTSPTATTAGAVNLVCSVCGDVVRELVYLHELTDANVENGTYDYSVSYRYFDGGTRGIYFYRIGVYALANTSYDIPDFTVELNTNIRVLSTCDLSSGTANGTFSATYLRSNQALDSARYGVYLDNLTAGTYKLTISSGLDITATVIGTDGSSVDLITSSDMTEGRFSVADGVEYMLVFHSAPSSMRTNIQFTIEEAEEIVLSLTQSCELGILEGGNAAAGETGKAVEVKIDESLPEGSYQLKITGSGNIGRYYNFVITVNGEKYYTNINMVGGIGAAVTITLKGGDVITVANGNLIDMGGLVISMTEA